MNNTFSIKIQFFLHRHQGNREYFTGFDALPRRKNTDALAAEKYCKHHTSYIFVLQVRVAVLA